MENNITPVLINEALEVFNKRKPENKMSLNDLAPLIIYRGSPKGYMLNYLYQFSKGKRQCPHAILMEISRILKVTVDSLLKK